MSTIERRPVCDVPAVFPFDATVCDTCGNLLTAHESKQASNAYQGVNQAMWKVMLEFGGPWNIYDAAPCQDRAKQVIAHLDVCSLYWSRMNQPVIAELQVFEDSFTENSRAEVLSGRLWCLCGRYVNQVWAVADMTLGQLIWHTVNSGELTLPGTER